jgi:small subunit ribosomal protein S20
VLDPVSSKERPKVANIASAEKRNRQRLRRRARNVAQLSKVRSTVKKLGTSITARDGKTPDALLAAIKVLDKAAQKGVLKRRTASRKIARLNAQVAKAAKAAPVEAATKKKAKAPAKKATKAKAAKK